MTTAITGWRTLVRLNGFDGGAGELSTDAFIGGVLRAQSQLGIKPGSSVLELGCGAGAFLLALSRSTEMILHGVDVSEELLSVARAVIPHGSFHLHDLQQGQIGHPVFNRTYDFVLAHSVFQYLDLKSAAELFRGALRSASRAVLIADVPGYSRMEEAEALRADGLEPGEYQQKCASLAHTYFSEGFFGRLLKKRNSKTSGH